MEFAVLQSEKPQKGRGPTGGRQCRGVSCPSRLTGLAQTAETRLVVTGLSSVGRYAVMAREGSMSLYCTNLKSLLQRAGSAVSEGERFANLEIQETDDEFVYLDVRKESCYPWQRLEMLSGR